MNTTLLTTDGRPQFTTDPRIARARFVLLILVFSVLWSLPLVNWFPSLAWHDQQRLGQVSIFLLILPVLALATHDLHRTPLWTAGTRNGLVIILALGVVSAVFARQPLWAFTEIGVAVGGIALAVYVAYERQYYGSLTDRVILGTVFFVVIALLVDFFASYVAAIGAAISSFDVYLLLDGFSNPRFLGQFLTLSLPLLAAPLLVGQSTPMLRPVATCVLPLAWLLAIASGTRGTWLGLATVGCFALFLSAGTRRWVGVQVRASIVGVALFWLMFTFIPQLYGASVSNHASTRISSSLSAREVLWWQAVDMTVESPFLGLGPMHFADSANQVAAHPHQVLLQWSSEWGLIAAALFAWLVCRSGVAMSRVLISEGNSGSQETGLRVALSFSLGASLVQSMVDGVFVMPYTELWFAVCAGWLTALQVRSASTTLRRPVRDGLALGIACLGVAILAFVCVRDYPLLGESSTTSGVTSGHQQPRFWQQGVIVQKDQR